LLPRTEVKPPIGDGDNNFVVDEKALEMCIAIGLARAVVTVVLVEWRNLFKPIVDIRNEAALGVTLTPFIGFTVYPYHKITYRSDIPNLHEIGSYLKWPAMLEGASL